MAEYFGVRHFSPACSFFVKEFLKRTDPDIVLIEGPSDLNDLIDSICKIKSEMPAAILAYTDKMPVHSVMYPFAEFSPEYQAMMWAKENKKEVRFCDLPSYTTLAVYEERDRQNSDEIEKENSKDAADGESELNKTDENTEGKENSSFYNVYEKLEKITGLDTDTFWEYSFEYNKNYEDFMKGVHEYGKSLREFSEIDDHTLLREAFMRKIISENEKEGKVSVITGAFHTAGLENTEFSSEDRKITKKLLKIKSHATLMPYSYYRLSARSGYGAGTKAPAYYEMLWNGRKNENLDDVPPEYLAKIAEFQRKNGNFASSAQIIEALRLADTLCRMRGGNMPSLEDLRDAATTCLGEGEFGNISVACAQTEIGTKIGSLPEGTVCTALQQDFNYQMKELKLEKYRTNESKVLELDLRENLRVKTEKSAFLDLNRSFFLHRLLICKIDFARKSYTSQTNATWKEIWHLRWTPESEIQIVENSLNGDTLEQAAAFELNSGPLNAQSLSEAAGVLKNAFLCGLSKCSATAVKAVHKLSADCVSIKENSETEGMLSELLRFGNIRKINLEPVKPLINQLYLRFCLTIYDNCICDNNAAEEIIEAISVIGDTSEVHEFLDRDRFINVIKKIALSSAVNPLTAGFALAVLIEKGKVCSDEISMLMERWMGGSFNASEGALWFEGLAKKNKKSLIARLGIWEKVNDFIAGLNEEEFKSAVVSFRRTFAEFTSVEKNEIAENVAEIFERKRNIMKENPAIENQDSESAADYEDFDFSEFDYYDFSGF